jgi:GNAT superfamily N-acetyltransferase
MIDISTLSACDAHRLLPLLEQVHALHVAHQPEIYAPLDHATALDWLIEAHHTPGITTLIATQHDEILGYLTFECPPRTAPTPLHCARAMARLDAICVDQAHQRRGIGRALCEAFKAHALTHGATHMTASYGAFNTASQDLMAHMGMLAVTIRAEGTL